MKKILFLASNPKGTAVLNLGEESRFIVQALKGSSSSNAFQVEHYWAAQPRDIQRAMLDVKPSIVHISGHGRRSLSDTTPLAEESDFNHRGIQSSCAMPSAERSNGLVFQNELGQAQVVSDNALSDLFSLFAHSVECVILNGCDSETPAQKIAEHIPYVIGMKQAISDVAAIEFSAGFYQGLASGGSIEFSYKLGCNALQILNLPEHLTPVLLCQSHGSLALPLEPNPEAPTSSTTPDFLEPPFGGPVPLESRFYLERFAHEESLYQAILNPGCLLRIVAPDLMGKTSLMARILNYASQADYHVVYLNLSDADHRIFQSLDDLLRWFYESIALNLDLPIVDEAEWNNGLLKGISNCTRLIDENILKNIEKPLVVGIDKLDQVFPKLEISTDYLAMIRNWFERSRLYPKWERLRLVLSYSSEDYSQFRMYQSPFNVGIPIELKELSITQIKDLCDRYSLNWQTSQIQAAMDMLGGHPYLLNIAMYYIGIGEISFSQLLNEAALEDGIYGEHLRRYWKVLSQQPQLANALKRVMTAKTPVELERTEGYQLRSMGLVRYGQGNTFKPSCKLYQLYFGH
jgi:hypothetical protein